MKREERIRLARQLLESGVLSEESANVIKADFPELSESEDERIRKALIDGVRQIRCKNGGITQEQMIAYLEKQKEQKPSAGYCTLEEKWREVEETARNEYKRGYMDGRREQKPTEWSEEEKRAIDRACVALRAYSNGDLPEFLPSELLGYADRLQSLRPQPHWKPSEEQMNILDKVYHYLWADRNATADMQDGLGDFIDELKSL